MGVDERSAASKPANGRRGVLPDRLEMIVVCHLLKDRDSDGIIHLFQRLNHSAACHPERVSRQRVRTSYQRIFWRQLWNAAGGAISTSFSMI
jgi:hypothetical protein